MDSPDLPAIPASAGALIFDRAGRLQIPRDFVDTLGMRDRVLLALEPDHLGVWPDTASPPHHTRRGGQTDGDNPVPGTEGNRP